MTGWVRRWTGSVWTRLALAMLLVSLLGAVATVVVGEALLRRADEASARRSLAVLADAYQAQANAGAQQAADEALGAKRVRQAMVRRDGRLQGDALARTALTPAQVQQVLSGQAVSVRVVQAGVVVLAEARPLAGGGAVVLAQRRVDAPSLSAQVQNQWYAAIAGVAVLAGASGLLLAWWITRPVRRLARSATALAAGEREPVPVGGPTELRAVATGLNELSTSLQHAEARQREFLMSVSHDLRTPLATVAGYAEALAEGGVPAEEVAGVGRVLQTESARLGRMVSDLLDLARLDADELVMRPEPTQIGALVDQTYAAWRERCRAKGVELRLEAGGEAVVDVDPGRLRQAVDGLLDNALRATPAGQPVVLSTQRTDSDVVLEVRDGGPGLDDSDLPVAFDRGALNERYRGRREVGTRLGLALVDRLVRRQGGTVTAGHAAEGGACFTITLPLAPDTT